MRVPLSGLPLVAAAILMAGCGGSTSSGASGKPLSAAAPTRASLVTAADAVCRRLNRELAGDNIATVQDIVRVVGRRAAREQRALDELGRLAVPVSLAPQWQQILASRRAIIESIIKVGQVVRTGKVHGMEPILTKSADIARRMRTTAQRAGFSDCATVG